MERSIPITKRQHDNIAPLLVQQAQLQSVISAKCNTILEGLADVIDEATIMGVRATKKGSFELVLEVAPPAKPLKAPRVRR